MYYGFFDGACEGNPGRIGLGISICDETHEIAVGAGPVSYGTNNDAEYLSLISLLECAAKMGIKELVVYGDSQLIINHVNGKWNAGEKFQPMLAKVSELKNHFISLHFHWISRTKNFRADKLSKRGLVLDEWKFVVKKDVIEANEVSAQVSSVVSNDNVLPKSASSEIRIGLKYAVVIENNQTYMINLQTTKCTCGVIGCSHLSVLNTKTAA